MSTGLVALGLLCFSALPLLAGCEGQPPGGLATTRLRIGQRQYALEIANTDASRTYGLMRRDALDTDGGMIFVFPDEASRGFWMKNTRIPLDILLIAADGRVVSIHTMKPYDLSSTRSKGPAKWAIELNAGQAAASGVKEGDRLVIPPEAQEAKE